MKMGDAIAVEILKGRQVELRQHIVIIKDETGAIIYERALILH
jgi:hypothetical protein